MIAAPVAVLQQLCKSSRGNPCSLIATVESNRNCFHLVFKPTPRTCTILFLSWSPLFFPPCRYLIDTWNSLRSFECLLQLKSTIEVHLLSFILSHGLHITCDGPDEANASATHCYICASLYFVHRQRYDVSMVLSYLCTHVEIMGNIQLSAAKKVDSIAIHLDPRRSKATMVLLLSFIVLFFNNSNQYLCDSIE